MTLISRRPITSLLVLMGLGLVFVLAACGEEEDSIPAGGSAGAGEEEAPADTTETTETSSDPTDTNSQSPRIRGSGNAQQGKFGNPRRRPSRRRAR